MNFAIPVERFNGFWLKIVDEIAWSLVIFADSERAIGFVFSVVKNLSFSKKPRNVFSFAFRNNERFT